MKEANLRLRAVGSQPCHSEKGKTTETGKDQWLPGAQRKEAMDKWEPTMCLGQQNYSV